MGVGCLLGSPVCWLLRPLARATLAWDEQGLERRARWGGWRYTWDQFEPPTLLPGPAFVLRLRGRAAGLRLACASLGDQARPLFELLRGRMAQHTEARLMLQPDREQRRGIVVAMVLLLGMASFFAYGAVLAATHQFRDTTPKLDTVNALVFGLFAVGLGFGAVVLRGQTASLELDHDGLTWRLGRHERRMAWTAVRRITLRRDNGGAERLVVRGDEGVMVLRSVGGMWLDAVAWTCRHAVGAEFVDASRHQCSALWRDWLAEATGSGNLPPAPRPPSWPPRVALGSVLLLLGTAMAAPGLLAELQNLTIPPTEQRTAQARVTRVDTSPLGGRTVWYEFQVGSVTHTGGARQPRLSAGDGLSVVYRVGRPIANRPMVPAPSPARVALLRRWLRIVAALAAASLAGMALVIGAPWLGRREWALPSRQLA